MMPEKKIFQPLSSKDVCLIYELLHREGYLSFPITDEGKAKVSALVSSITETYFGQQIYISVEEKVVAYMFFIVKNHPFTDGNKRMACLVFEGLCNLNDLEPKYDGFDLDAVAVFLEKVDKDMDHQVIIKALAGILFPHDIP